MHCLKAVKGPCLTVRVQDRELEDMAHQNSLASGVSAKSSCDRQTAGTCKQRMIRGVGRPCCCSLPFWLQQQQLQSRSLRAAVLRMMLLVYGVAGWAA